MTISQNKSGCNSDETVGKKQPCNYVIYEWEENKFLEDVKTILTLVSHVPSIHKIVREKGKILYLVPEDYYLTCKKKLAEDSVCKDTL